MAYCLPDRPYVLYLLFPREKYGKYRRLTIDSIMETTTYGQEHCSNVNHITVEPQAGYDNFTNIRIDGNM